jgi:hypothetical protein
MRNAGFDVSFRDCPAKGGTGGNPNRSPSSEADSRSASQELPAFYGAGKFITVFTETRVLTRQFPVLCTHRSVSAWLYSERNTETLI